jgi:signal transduction histidine kinase
MNALNQAHSLDKMILDAIESIDEGFALFDQNEQLVHCNQQFRKLYPSLSSSLIKGAYLEKLQWEALKTGDILPPPNVKADTWLIGRISERRSDVCQTEYKLKDGRWIMATDIKTPSGNTVSIRVNATELKERETNLLTAKENAEATNLAKNEFLAMISHELITPLNAMMGFADVMDQELLGEIKNPKYKEYIKDILFSGNHLLEIIHDILELSTIEAGKSKLDLSPVDPIKVVKNILKLFDHQALKDSLSLRLNLIHEINPIQLDKRKLKQILINLLGNALKFSTPGGIIEITVKNGPEEELILIIRDTGIGMDLQEIPKALEAFSQLQSGLNRNFEGVGLGLHLTKHFIELHNGTLSINSEKGKGTEITICFPRN